MVQEPCRSEIQWLAKLCYSASIASRVRDNLDCHLDGLIHVDHLDPIFVVARRYVRAVLHRSHPKKIIYIVQIV